MDWRFAESRNFNWNSLQIAFGVVITLPQTLCKASQKFFAVIETLSQLRHHYIQSPTLQWKTSKVRHLKQWIRSYQQVQNRKWTRLFQTVREIFSLASMALALPEFHRNTWKVPAIQEVLSITKTSRCPLLLLIPTEKVDKATSIKRMELELDDIKGNSILMQLSSISYIWGWVLQNENTKYLQISSQRLEIFNLCSDVLLNCTLSQKFCQSIYQLIINVLISCCSLYSQRHYYLHSIKAREFLHSRQWLLWMDWISPETQQYLAMWWNYNSGVHTSTQPETPRQLLYPLGFPGMVPAIVQLCHHHRRHYTCSLTKKLWDSWNNRILNLVRTYMENSLGHFSHVVTPKIQSEVKWHTLHLPLVGCVEVCYLLIVRTTISQFLSRVECFPGRKW